MVQTISRGAEDCISPNKIDTGEAAGPAHLAENVIGNENLKFQKKSTEFLTKHPFSIEMPMQVFCII